MGAGAAALVATLLLFVWFLVSLWRLPALDQQSVAEWLKDPLAAVPMLLLIVSTFWHLKLGLIVVVEDYVHEAGNRFACVLVINFAQPVRGRACDLLGAEARLRGNPGLIPTGATPGIAGRPEQQPAQERPVAALRAHIEAMLGAPSSSRGERRGAGTLEAGTLETSSGGDTISSTTRDVSAPQDPHFAAWRRHAGPDAEVAAGRRPVR